MHTSVEVKVAIAVVFIAANMFTGAVLLLFFGWKLYKVFASILTGCIAAVLAWFYITPLLPPKYGMFAPVVVGAIGIAVAIPLQRVVAFAITGALGAVIAAAVGVRYMNVPFEIAASQFQIAAGVGFIVAGVAGAVFFRFIMVFITSAYGGALALGGASMIAVACLRKWPVPETLKSGKATLAQIQTLPGSFLLAAFGTWAALTLIGVVYQYRTMEPPKATKKSKDKDESKPAKG